jgi:hypothetical protein
LRDGEEGEPGGLRELVEDALLTETLMGWDGTIGTPMEPRRVELFRGHDARGSRSVDAELGDDGRLVIDGQDLGPQVQVFGPDFREYEWAWTIAPEQLPRVIEVLGGGPGDDPLELLIAWSKGRKGEDPGPFLRDGGVELAFWSRLGD